MGDIGPEQQRYEVLPVGQPERRPAESPRREPAAPAPEPARASR